MLVASLIMQAKAVGSPSSEEQNIFVHLGQARLNLSQCH